MNAIELSHVTKHFPGFTLQDLSLTVPSGTICGLVGENGAGKSTTIRLLMGALRPDSGTCTVLGADSAAPEFLSLKEDIGVVLDEAYFPESLNALQVGGVMAKTYRRWDGKQYQNYLTRFGLPEKKPFKDFSRGMKMKLAIAVALSHSPRLLVLDEATAGLDPIVRDEVLEIFNEFTREEDHSILISSHNLRELEDVCDHVGIMHKGKIIVERSLSDLQGNVSKIQVAFQEGMPTLPKDFEILHMSNTGRVYTLIVKGNPERAKMILEETHPMLIDILPLTLEEIFIYEMGGKNYEIKDILF